MLEFLYNIDKALFYFLNHSISNNLFDRLFPFITDVKNWYIAYVILFFILFFKGGRIGKIAAIMSLILITVSDQFSSAFLKNLIERARPCNELPDVNLLVFCSGSYSMPSSHAVNNFAIAMFISYLYPKLKFILFSVASVIAITRPYVGVHYPSDIIAGAFIGILIGYLFALLAIKLNAIIETKLRKE